MWEKCESTEIMTHEMCPREKESAMRSSTFERKRRTCNVTGETLEAHMFKADLPGLKKEEVKVKIEEDDRVLQISTERNFEKEEKNNTWHRVERSSGRFTGRFRLPKNE
ncbi:hypothetical protein ACSBR2_003807 [Camellia fascicularis]